MNFNDLKKLLLILQRNLNFEKAESKTSKFWVDCAC